MHVSQTSRLMSEFDYKITNKLNNLVLVSPRPKPNLPKTQWFKPLYCFFLLQECNTVMHVLSHDWIKQANWTRTKYNMQNRMNVLLSNFRCWNWKPDWILSRHVYSASIKYGFLGLRLCPYQLEWRIRLVEASLKFEGTVKQTQAFKPDLTKMILMESVERISIWKSWTFTHVCMHTSM